ncbi:836_t:CDS:2, partial [Gigaspora rosea]
DTSLTLIQSVFTQPNIYSQAAAFAITDPILHTHLLIKLKTGCINLFESLSELFFEQFFQDSLNWNFLIIKSIVTTAFVCKATSTRQIDQRLPLILVVNVTGINITNEGFYLESKDLLEEISFPEDVHIKQRYYLMGASFCNSNYHIADVRFENVKNAGWYQYD